ncbi:MAG: GCN5-related N-acetyltransferase [Firmicutes bacterium]|nr:GCN5-related N-acetyltransferase [Bacillota bacterium]
MIEVRIRKVTPTDLNRVAEIEAICFPAAEAASQEAFQQRIAAFPEYFLVAEINDTLVGFINGCVTNSSVIYDELFANTQHHVPNGVNASVFGLDVIPEYRNQGIAAQLMKHFIQEAKIAGKKSIILTCKAKLIHYYASFGYVNDGVSKSTHGGAEWFDMTLVL